RPRLGNRPGQPVRRVRGTGRLRHSRRIADRSGRLTIPRCGVCFRKRGSPRGKTRDRAPLEVCSTTDRAARMQEATQQPTILSEATDPIAAAAFRAEAWAGEPFLRDGEDPA